MPAYFGFNKFRLVNRLASAKSSRRTITASLWRPVAQDERRTPRRLTINLAFDEASAPMHVYPLPRPTAALPEVRKMLSQPLDCSRRIPKVSKLFFWKFTKIEKYICLWRNLLDRQLRDKTFLGKSTLCWQNFGQNLLDWHLRGKMFLGKCIFLDTTLDDTS